MANNKCRVTVQLLLFPALLWTEYIHAQGPYPEGYPGSGYGCSNTCGGDDDDADVRYVLKASLENYTLPGSASLVKKYGLLDDEGSRDEEGGYSLGMLTRTFVGVQDDYMTSPHCMDGYDGSTGPLGPCLSVNPGQRIKIKVINEMKDGMELLMQQRASLEGYWNLTATPGNPDLDSIDWFGEAPSTPEGLHISNTQDLPGWDTSFDDVNIHLHGMQIVPHLFYPQGTGNPDAEWITIEPENNENPDSQCFCYVFDVPEDHPQGTFFYHVHRHGSVAMQMWQGMFGLLYVGNETNPGSPSNELRTQGVTREEPLVLWEWAVNPQHQFLFEDGASNTTSINLSEGNFLFTDDGDDAVTTFLTNNEYQPTFDMDVNETVHYRLLCGQTTTGSAVYILDEEGDIVPFFVFASDGISYSKPYRKDMIVIGPGQREGLLLQFPKAGMYRIMQGIINDFQGDGEGVGYGAKRDNDDEPLAFVHVAVAEDEGYDDGAAASLEKNNHTEASPVRAMNISSLTFTPGMGRRGGSINTTEISHQLAVNFQVFSQLDTAPVPQFVIDGKPFDYRNISHTVPAGSGQQWTISSNMDYFHPFHIHVNPFQVKHVTTGYLPGEELRKAVLQTSLEPEDMWRDTVFVPPFGQVTLWQRFGEIGGDAWQGKTVYHCHFLDHEDQGMIAAMVIGDPDGKEPHEKRRRLRAPRERVWTHLNSD